jgi:nitrogenase-associated protein
MSTVIFYEKPGCGNNTKQKIWLASSGHTVIAKNLLTENWNVKRLRAFFESLPVEQWFNPSAPKIKSGAINPAKLDAETALDMMIVEPLLIRRPLMEVEGVFCVGFDAKAVDAWIGLNDTRSKEEDASPLCTHSEPCRPPELVK